MCASLGLYAASWETSHWAEFEDYYNGSRVESQECLLLDYRRFNTLIRQNLTLKAGDVLEGRVANEEGRVSVYILAEESGEVICEGDDLKTGTFRVEIPEDGTYEVNVTGRQAVGSVRIQKEGAAPMTDAGEAPDAEETPEAEEVPAGQ